MPLPSTMVPIATVTVLASQATVTLSNIPQTYTDLILAGNGSISGTANTWLRVNGDSGTNYVATVLYGTGSTASSLKRTGDTAGVLLDAVGPAANGTQMYFTQIMSYASTNIFKTVIHRGGAAAQESVACVGVWRSTSAITSVTIYPDNSRTWNAGSTFTLYGIKAA